jgi:hypothetical protein
MDKLIIKINNAAINSLAPNLLGRPLRKPYLMLQPAHILRKEEKLVFLNGKFQFIAQFKGGYGHSCPAFSFNSHARLIEFAESALARFKSKVRY